MNAVTFLIRCFNQQVGKNIIFYLLINGMASFFIYTIIHTT